MTEHPERVNALKADELRRLRKLKGWRQEDLADRVRVTRETVSNWETGQWPDNALIEIGLATLFDKPATHIADAAQAVLTHETGTHRDGEIPVPLAQLHRLYALDPRHVTGRVTLHEMLDVVARQIDAVFRQAMPDGKVTLEGVQWARDSLRPKKPPKANGPEKATRK